MIFKQHFIDLILSGKKTQTRRPNRGYYVEGKTYAIQPCRTCKGIENYRIMIDDIWREIRDYEPERTNTKFMPISEEDAWAEGQYTPSEFEKTFRELYPKWNGKKRWVYVYHVVNVTHGLKYSNYEPIERAIFFIDGTPVPKGRPRATARGAYTILYTPKATKEYEEHVAKTASKHIPKTGMIMGPIAISLTFYLKPPQKYAKKMVTPHVTRPDVDNLAKAILDGLEGILYKNDAQVTTLYAHKCYGDKPRVGVSVSELVELIGEKKQNE